MYLLLLVWFCCSTEWKLPEVHGSLQTILCRWTEEYWGVSGMTQYVICCTRWAVIVSVEITALLSWQYLVAFCFEVCVVFKFSYRQTYCVKLAGMCSCSWADGWSLSCSRCQSVTILRWDDGHAAGKLGCMYECTSNNQYIITPGGDYKALGCGNIWAFNGGCRN